MTPQQRNVAMAFETYALYPPLTVYENIAFPLQVMKWKKEDIDKKVREVAKRLSITNILNNFPDSLAGGQKQRVSLARALVRDPTVFLMDEPLSHVDADVRYRARAEIKHIKAISNSTVIYVTHDQVEAVALADRVIVMDLGVIQQIGTPKELYFKPANLFVAGFMGEPPINLIPGVISFTDEAMKITWCEDEKSVLHISNKDVPAAAKKALNEYAGKEVVVGIRPQRLVIAAVSGKRAERELTGTLLVHEFLGKTGIAQVDLGHSVVECVTAPSIPQQAGDTVSVSAAFEDLHFFDPETTCRIEY